jgi:hypothetical protein
MPLSCRQEAIRLSLLYFLRNRDVIQQWLAWNRGRNTHLFPYNCDKILCPSILENPRPRIFLGKGDWKASYRQLTRLRIKRGQNSLAFPRFSLRFRIPPFITVFYHHGILPSRYSTITVFYPIVRWSIHEGNRFRFVLLLSPTVRN